MLSPICVVWSQGNAQRRDGGRDYDQHLSAPRQCVRGPTLYGMLVERGTAIVLRADTSGSCEHELDWVARPRRAGRVEA